MVTVGELRSEAIFAGYQGGLQNESEHTALKIEGVYADRKLNYVFGERCASEHKAQGSDSWWQTKQNQGHREKGNWCPWKQWHSSCQTPRQPSRHGYWTQNPCDAVPLKDLNSLKS